jgi:RNA binding exosome subunit
MNNQAQGNKAKSFIDSLSIELRDAVISIAETIKPALDDIHANTPTTQNYYGDYMRLLSYKPERKKVIALAMLYAGANPQGVEAAVKNV